MAAVKRAASRSRRPVRREAPVRPEEFDNLESVHAWWNTVIRDERFFLVMDHIKRRKRYRNQLQALPHQAHYAEGHKDGYDDACDNFQEPIRSLGPEENEQEQEPHPELTD